MRNSCPKERKAYPRWFLIFFFNLFRELIISRGCCSDSSSRSRKASDRPVKRHKVLKVEEEGRNGTWYKLSGFWASILGQCSNTLLCLWGKPWEHELPKNPIVHQSEGVKALPLSSILKCSSISRIDGAVLLWTLGWPLGGGLCYC